MPEMRRGTGTKVVQIQGLGSKTIEIVIRRPPDLDLLPLHHPQIRADGLLRRDRIEITTIGKRPKMILLFSEMAWKILQPFIDLLDGYQ